MTPTERSLAVWAKDTAERVGATFVGGFVAAITVTSAAGVETLDLSRASLAVGIAGAAALASLAKALLARYVGDSASASLAPSLRVEEAEPRG